MEYITAEYLPPGNGQPARNVLTVVNSTEGILHSQKERGLILDYITRDKKANYQIIDNKIEVK